MNTTITNAAAEDLGTGEPVRHAANAVLLAPDASGAMRVLLAQRDHAPDIGMWGLPGGVCQPGEAPAQVAVRRCREKTGVDVEIEQLVHASSRDEGRDDAGRRVTVSYAVVLPRPVPASVGDMVRQVRWWPVAEALAQPLAFDHHRILQDAVSAAGLPVE
ncbi:NUDIX domain-containing protein [Amycolatopsis sp. NPDC058986]|uniref:NUDIX domain-containing protein n=1 Tax=unclassified Amycolatopsis TaxID=2618356 RepID=UPI00366D1FBC